MNPLTALLKQIVGGNISNVAGQAKNLTGATGDYIGYKLGINKEKNAKEFQKRMQAIADAQRAFGFDSEKPATQVDTGKLATGMAKTTADTASLLLPAGKTLKSAVALGAASGALRGAGEGDTFDKSKILSSAAGGAAGGAAGHGIQEAVKALSSGVSSRLGNSVFKESIKNTRAGIKKGETLGDLAVKKGIKGSSESIFNKSTQAISDLEDGLQNILVNSQEKVNTQDVKGAIKSIVDKYKASGNTSAADALMARIDAIEKANGSNIPLVGANQIKRALYDEVANGYGEQSSVSKEGLKALARAFKTGIEKAQPEVSQINKDLSLYGRVRDSMADKLSRGGRNNMLGLTDAIIASGGIASGNPIVAASPLVKDALGTTFAKTNMASTANKIANVSENEAITKLSQILGSSGGNLIQSLSNPPTQPQDNQQENSVPHKIDNNTTVQTDTQGQIDPNTEVILNDGTKTTYGQLQQSGTFQQQQNQSTSPISEEQFGQLVLLDLLQNGGKNIGTIKAAKELLIPEQTTTTKPLAAATENKQQLGKSGLRALTELESIIEKDPNKVLYNVIPGKLGSRDYDSAAYRAVEGLLRARSGAAVPETEVRRYMNANLPRLGDTPDDVKFKLAAFRRDLEDVASSGATSQGIDQSSLLQLLGAQ